MPYLQDLLPRAVRGSLSRLTIALSLSSLALACGSSSSSSSTAPPQMDTGALPGVDAGPPYDYAAGLTTEPTVLAACHRYAVAQVSYDGQCSEAIHPQKIAYLEERYELACRVAASEPGIVLDAPRIDECAGLLADWQKSSCAHRPTIGGTANPLRECASLLAGAGTLPEGDSCTAAVQCASGVCVQGLRLVAALGGGNAKGKSFMGCGSCARVVHQGEACHRYDDPPRADGLDVVCEPGAYCQSTCTGTGCNSRCVAAATEGQECGTQDFACAEGLSCRYLSIPQAFRCVKDRPVGAACAEQNECAPELSCMSHVCTPFSDTNGACRVDGATVPRDTNCMGDLACDPQKLTCSPITFGALKAPGEKCGGTLVQTVECAYDVVICEARLETVCPSAPQPEGARCQNATDCEGTSVCVDGTCQPLTTGACRKHASVE